MLSPTIFLRLTDIEGRERDLAWPEPKLQIGSHPSSGLVLQGRGISDYHCVLERVRDGYVLRDRGSRAGTFVNSERLTEPRTMVIGDRIYIGEYQLELLAPPAAPELVLEPSPPAPLKPRPARHMLAALVPLAALGLAALWVDFTPAPVPVAGDAAPRTALTPAPSPAVAPGPVANRKRAVQVRHEVAPGETVDEIAARYDVSAQQLIEDHDLNPDQHPKPGTILTFHAVDPPLPRLRLDYVVEPGDTWTILAGRFDVSIEHLQGANRDLAGKLTVGAHIHVWVDPQIEPRRDEVVRVAFPVKPGGRSIGAPSQGRLEGGIQLPPSPNYYYRVNPTYQFGASHTLQHLQEAIARFRQLYRYRGVLVLSDLSRDGGGPLPPHKSHQSGRDVDIWLPALQGTYLPKHIQQDSKPTSDQVNWYAAWGLVESLLSTGQVKYIFLDRSLHATLYSAADRMGADRDLLAEIQSQPDDSDPALAARARYRGTIRHADHHVRHIHVRFKCPAGDTQCVDKPVTEEP